MSISRYALTTNKAFCHILGSMEDMRYNDAGKQDKAKTSHVLGLNPWPDMQVLPDALRNTFTAVIQQA